MDFKDLARATRPENCVISAIGVLAGSVIAAGQLLAGYPLALAMVSAALVTAAGNMINDFYDLEVDKRLGREKKGGKHSYALSLILFGGGIFLAAFVNRQALFIASGTSILLILYSGTMQKFKFAGNWVVAIGTAATIIFGASISGNYYAAILPAFSALFANAAREIIKDTEDQKGDKGAKKTLPMMVSKSVLNNYIITLYALAIGLAIFAFQLGTMPGWLYIPLLGAASLIFMHSALKYGAGDYALARTLSKYGMVASLAAFMAGAI